MRVTKNLILCLALAASASAADLARVTASEYVYSAPGGERVVAHDIAVPAEATDVAWDADTRTLSWAIPATEEAEATTGSVVVTPEQLTAAEAALDAPQPVPVPERVSKAQLKLALLMAGVDINTLIDSLPADERAIARIVVDDAEYFARDANMVDRLNQQLDPPKSETELDDLFRTAAQIDPATI